LKQTKTLIIDYIILGNEYNRNSIFYPLFSLVQQYFSDNLIDIDYYVMEVSTRSLEENVDKESYPLSRSEADRRSARSRLWGG